MVVDRRLRGGVPAARAQCPGGGARHHRHLICLDCPGQLFDSARRGEYLLVGVWMRRHIRADICPAGVQRTSAGSDHREDRCLPSNAGAGSYIDCAGGTAGHGDTYEQSPGGCGKHFDRVFRIPGNGVGRNGGTFDPGGDTGRQHHLYIHPISTRHSRLLPRDTVGSANRNGALWCSRCSSKHGARRMLCARRRPSTGKERHH